MLPAIRSSRFDLPLTYDAGNLDLRIGDIVRVPIGRRDHVAFVVSSVREEEPARPLRAITRVPDVPRAFDETGLALAGFVSDYDLCTLGEALGAAVLSMAVPRTVDTFVCAGEQPPRSRHSSIPPRLLRLIWSELHEGFTLDRLLRHPEARRSGDRAALLRYVNALVRSGDLRRERRVVDPRTREYQVRTLFPGSGTVRGRKATALAAFVRSNPGIPRADALLAGFSAATIARAAKAEAVVERRVAPVRTPRAKEVALPEVRPTHEQQRAIAALRDWIDRRAFHEALLFGVTGSGKTLVYIFAIAHVLRSGGRAIVLVPEISLTPQTARRFETAFGGRVAVLHSALSDRERFEAWQACARGEIDVLVGARSAVFAPMQDVRLLIVDESHEPSYRQENVPRYHAVTVARERMRLSGGVLVLGSATPALESYAAAQSGKTGLLELSERATGQPLPAVHVVDMAREFEEGNRRIFSAALLQALQARISRGEKAVLFVNRRGSSGFMLCRACGHVPECPRCSVSLTLHRSDGLLRCHYCDFQRPIPPACERCGSVAFREFGAGTQRVAEEVSRLFPDASVVRMDGDTTTHVGDHARLLDAFAASGDVLVGTQMVAKGLDFPTVTLATAVAADIGLHAPDFRAAERTFALVTQVCGRSGRARGGEALVQTYAAGHHAIRFAAMHDYRGFAAEELQERRRAGFPPFAQMIYLGVIGRDRPKALLTARTYASLLESETEAVVLGPAPYPIERLNNEWRFRIALKGKDLDPLRSAVREMILPAARKERATRLVVLVDP